MKKEREDLLDSILDERDPEARKKYMDGVLPKRVGLSVHHLTPEIINKLERNGFLVITPAQLSEKAKEGLSQEKLKQYNDEIQRGNALVLDKTDIEPYLDLGYKIDETYLSIAKKYMPPMRLGAVGVKPNGNRYSSVNFKGVEEYLENGAKDHLADIYESVGFDVEKDTDKIRYSSDKLLTIDGNINGIASVDEEVFENAYDTSRGGIANLIGKIKASATRGTENEYDGEKQE